MKLNVPNISVIIPLLNEAESILELSDWIISVMLQHKFTYEIIFINDGSTDKSWDVIEQLSNNNSNIKGINFRRNYGKSAALHEGFQNSSGEVVITMDADLQDSPNEIPALYEMIKTVGFDVVSGWKKERFDPLTKTLPTKLFNSVTRKMSGISLNDFNCGLKAYSSDVVHAIEIYGEMHRYIPVLAKWAGFTKIGEKVVKHQARKYGKSKFGFSRFINGFLDLLTLFFVGKFGKKPMHFFGTLGLFTFFIGLLILAYLSVLKIFGDVVGIANRPSFYFGILSVIIGAQLFLTGFLAELITRNSESRNYYIIKNKIGLV